jgi:hypothetical protein
MANAIPDTNMRVNTLVALAGAWRSVHPTFERSALRQVIKLADDPKADNWFAMKAAAGMLLKLGDKASAEEAVNASAKAISKLYDEDANPTDPNQFAKFFWPSTQAWRDLIEIASKISPTLANGIVNRISDSEIKAVERVMLADCWLKVPLWRSTSPMVAHKRNGSAGG